MTVKLDSFPYYFENVNKNKAKQVDGAQLTIEFMFANENVTSVTLVKYTWNNNDAQFAKTIAFKFNSISS